METTDRDISLDMIDTKRKNLAMPSGSKRVQYSEFNNQLQRTLIAQCYCKNKISNQNPQWL